MSVKQIAAVRKSAQTLAGLRNVARAALADFRLLGIKTVADLAAQDADTLYVRLCETTGRRHDPCVHDVFAATIQEARTGEAVDCWAFTPARKARQLAGTFPEPAAEGGVDPTAL